MGVLWRNDDDSIKLIQFFYRSTFIGRALRLRGLAVGREIHERASCDGWGRLHRAGSPIGAGITIDAQWHDAHLAGARSTGSRSHLV